VESGQIDFIAGGTVTSSRGFRAGATAAGIKKNAGPSLDLGILFSEVSCVTAGVLTTSQIKSAPVMLCQERLVRDTAVAIVANSGCSNVYTGEPGLTDAREMTALTATALGSDPEDILIASTGVTGQRLPIDMIKDGIRQIALSTEGGHELAKAIMTTDTRPKETAVIVRAGDDKFTIGGIAKGSGMIHPNMATMLSFLTTDAAVEPVFLRSALHQAADVSFNMISVDGDTSPSDTVLLLANGLAKNKTISADSPLAQIFEQALTQVCLYLAKTIASDGEGATQLIEATVHGATTMNDARLAAKAIITSSLVKTEVHGKNLSWGRIIAALGRSGAAVVESKIDIAIGKIKVVKAGRPLIFRKADILQVFESKEVPIRVNLNLGTASATAWGCDLTSEYININSQYRT
tara:strand:- start:860 stop:2080 length:1221 start_codon:yes stop_codon:yes gene_type:complete